MATERIVALDPGGTTGWAMWQSMPITLGSPPPPWDHFTCGQIGDGEHHEELYDWLCHLQTHDFTVVCESFEFRKGDEHRAGISLISREYIGVAKLMARQRGAKFALQTAGAAKGFVPDKPQGGLPANAKLKAMGLYVPSQKHAMDAMRHLIYYLVNRRGMIGLIEPWKNLT